MIAVWEGAINGSPHGIMLCVVGTVCNAAMMSTSGRLLSEKLDVLRLAFYTAPVSCIALFPFCYSREVRHVLWTQGVFSYSEQSGRLCLELPGAQYIDCFIA